MLGHASRLTKILHWVNEYDLHKPVITHPLGHLKKCLLHNTFMSSRCFCILWNPKSKWWDTTAAYRWDDALGFSLIISLTWFKSEFHLPFLASFSLSPKRLSQFVHSFLSLKDTSLRFELWTATTSKIPRIQMSSIFPYQSILLLGLIATQSHRLQIAQQKLLGIQQLHSFFFKLKTCSFSDNHMYPTVTKISYQGWKYILKNVKQARLLSWYPLQPRYDCHLVPVVSFCLPITYCVQLCPGVPTERKMFLAPLLVVELTKYESGYWESRESVRMGSGSYAFAGCLVAGLCAC